MLHKDICGFECSGKKVCKVYPIEVNCFASENMESTLLNLPMLRRLRDLVNKTIYMYPSLCIGHNMLYISVLLIYDMDLCEM